MNTDLLAPKETRNNRVRYATFLYFYEIDYLISLFYSYNNQEEVGEEQGHAWNNNILLNINWYHILL